MSRLRSICHCSFAIGALSIVLVEPVAAQSPTTCSVTLVVSFSAGGGTNSIARVFAQGLAKQLGQQVVVENVTGAGGMLGTARVAKAAANGCVIAFGGTSDTVNQTLYHKPLYNLLADFIPLAYIAEQPTVLIARKDFPANNLPEFIAYAKAHQDELTFGATVGSSSHLFCGQFNGATGLKATLIPYRGGSAAIPDIISGQIDYLCTLNLSAKPPIDAKQVKPIAIFSLHRSSFLPDVPTADEQGLSRFNTPTWFGLLLPKGTPTDVVKRLRDATAAALDDPQVKSGMEKIGADIARPEQRAPGYFEKFVVDDIARNAEIIKAANIPIQ